MLFSNLSLQYIYDYLKKSIENFIETMFKRSLTPDLYVKPFKEKVVKATTYNKLTIYLQSSELIRIPIKALVGVIELTNDNVLSFTNAYIKPIVNKLVEDMSNVEENCPCFLGVQYPKDENCEFVVSVISKVISGDSDFQIHPGEISEILLDEDSIGEIVMSKQDCEFIQNNKIESIKDVFSNINATDMIYNIPSYIIGKSETTIPSAESLFEVISKLDINSIRNSASAIYEKYKKAEYDNGSKDPQKRKYLKDIRILTNEDLNKISEDDLRKIFKNYWVSKAYKDENSYYDLFTLYISCESLIEENDISFIKIKLIKYSGSQNSVSYFFVDGVYSILIYDTTNECNYHVIQIAQMDKNKPDPFQDICGFELSGYESKPLFTDSYPYDDLTDLSYVLYNSNEYLKEPETEYTVEKIYLETEAVNKDFSFEISGISDMQNNITRSLINMGINLSDINNFKINKKSLINEDSHIPLLSINVSKHYRDKPVFGNIKKIKPISLEENLDIFKQSCDIICKNNILFESTEIKKINKNTLIVYGIK